MSADRNTIIRSSQIRNSEVRLIDLHDEVKIGSIGFVIDGGDLVIEAGVAADLEIPFDCEIQAVTLLADQSGSIQIDIFKDTYANYPPASSITASAKPTISSSDKSKDVTLAGWTKTISAGDTLRFNVDSVTTIERCLINLKIKRV